MTLEQLDQDVEDLNCRIAILEEALARQRMINESLRIYVEADIATTWLDSAKALSDAIEDALKEDRCHV